MLPREFLREHAERLLADAPERFANSGIERFLAVDTRRRDVVTRLEEKRRRRNELTSVRGKPDPATLAAERHRLGFDKPLPEQYADWLSRGIRLDFGE